MFQLLQVLVDQVVQLVMLEQVVKVQDQVLQVQLVQVVHQELME